MENLSFDYEDKVIATYRALEADKADLILDVGRLEEEVRILKQAVRDAHEAGYNSVADRLNQVSDHVGSHDESSEWAKFERRMG